MVKPEDIETKANEDGIPWIETESRVLIMASPLAGCDTHPDAPPAFGGEPDTVANPCEPSCLESKPPKGKCVGGKKAHPLGITVVPNDETTIDDEYPTDARGTAYRNTNDPHNTIVG